MELWQIALIVLAGIGAGGINAVVGSGTLITFPVLVAFGVPPVVSTMSNAVGLIPGNIASSFGYREELKGQWRRIL
ncbi:MAG: TSUP family transporter, partial [Brevibacterium aurantiacum]|uniref:TSUP family transporter n=2 Tax=Brevibacterium TaxID=1696 RepID=UPI003F8E1CB8